MTPGNPDVRFCSQCQKLVAQSTLNSGNTFGAIYWLDNKQEAPMLPDYPDLGRCPHCHILMRQSTSKKAKVKAQHDLPAGADWLCEPDEADWLESLQNRLWKSKDEKIYARIATWHRANDKVRQREAEPQFSALALQNLRELDALFRTGVEPFFVVLRAEIARETGDFEGALQLLESADSQFEPVTAQIAALARARDTSIKRRTA